MNSELPSGTRDLPNTMLRNLTRLQPGLPLHWWWFVVVVQQLCHIQLFSTPWTAVHLHSTMILKITLIVMLSLCSRKDNVARLQKKKKKRKNYIVPAPLAKPFSVIIHLSASLIFLCPYHPLDPSPPPFYFPVVLFCSLSILPLNWTLSVTAVIWIQLVLPHLTNRLCCLFVLTRIYGSKWKEN